MLKTAKKGKNMLEKRQIKINQSDYSYGLGAEEVIISAFEKVFPDFNIEIDYFTKEKTSVFGKFMNSKIFLSEVENMMEDINSTLIHYDWNNVKIEDSPNFPLEYPIEFFNFFKDKKNLKKMPVSLSIESRHLESINNKNFRFQLALETALSEHLKEGCKVNIEETPAFSNCPTCGRGQVSGRRNSIKIMNEENTFESEIVSRTNKFQPFIKRVNKKEF